MLTQDLRGLRPHYPEHRDLTCEIFNFHLVHDDVAIEDLQNRFQLLRFRFDHDALRPIECVQIGLNFPLWIQEKGINTLTSSQIANIVGDHSVQPAHPVCAG